ncbi:hypothetical protein [Pseudonocardia sp. ICBG601]|uniref:hypothetical protein n=1 Tax=Pseudonocardia sp. ICBG601 TaxID=2846759 RepID=UPI001CF6DD0D|nr:hypothetical protein [Pseudonocardia sp. ICBG601]
MPTRATSRSWPRALLREARSLPTLLLLALIAVVGVPLVILLTPENHVEVFGQDVGVGARVPPLTLSGPAQIAQLGKRRVRPHDRAGVGSDPAAVVHRAVEAARRQRPGPGPAHRRRRR